MVPKWRHSGCVCPYFISLMGDTGGLHHTDVTCLEKLRKEIWKGGSGSSHHLQQGQQQWVGRGEAFLQVVPPLPSQSHAPCPLQSVLAICVLYRHVYLPVRESLVGRCTWKLSFGNWLAQTCKSARLYLHTVLLQSLYRPTPTSLSLPVPCFFLWV